MPLVYQPNFNCSYDVRLAGAISTVGHVRI